MRNDRHLKLGFLSAGGWDNHANQGNATGRLANNLGRAISQLRQDFSEPGDVGVVMSEFGRTAVENGTRGAEHEAQVKKSKVSVKRSTVGHEQRCECRQQIFSAANNFRSTA